MSLATLFEKPAADLEAKARIQKLGREIEAFITEAGERVAKVRRLAEGLEAEDRQTVLDALAALLASIAKVAVADRVEAVETAIVEAKVAAEAKAAAAEEVAKVEVETPAEPAAETPKEE